MHQLHASDFASLENLFTQVPANEPMLRAFLNGRVPGHAFVDVFPSPTAAVVAVNYRFVFFGGAPAQEFQKQAVRQLCYQQAIDVVWPAAPVKLPSGPSAGGVITRMEYRQRRNRSNVHLDTLANGAPQAEVKRIDSHNIAQCLWRDDVLRATGSTSEFLGHGLGFCLMVGEAILAEAYAVIWNGDRAEIAAVTHPKHRGHGYATMLCAALIQACEAVELQTYWNCDVENGASMRLAAKLGYQDPHEYRQVRFPQQAPVSKFEPRKRVLTFGSLARRLLGRAPAKR